MSDGWPGVIIFVGVLACIISPPLALGLGGFFLVYWLVGLTGFHD